MGVRRTVPQPEAVNELLALAGSGLAEAAAEPRAHLRFAAAHLAALRGAAAIVAARSPAVSRSRIRSVWELLATVAPEFAEWAAFFQTGAAKRSAAQAGVPVVNAREADDLYRDAVTFVNLVRAAVDVPLVLPVAERALLATG